MKYEVVWTGNCTVDGLQLKSPTRFATLQAAEEFAENVLGSYYSPEVRQTLTELEVKVLAALRSTEEGETYAPWAKEHEVWAQVYLDNAQDESGLSRRSFAGVLASLKAKGMYRGAGDDAFGSVLRAPR